MRERFLKRLYFGIAADPGCANILEEFVFTFAYGADDTTAVRLDATAAGGAQRAAVGNLGDGSKAGGAGAGAGDKPGGKPVSVRHVKNQIFRLMRTLVELCSTLEDVPEERHIFMRLTYNDDAPDDYEPPHFQPASEEQANGAFAAQPFSMKAGGLTTEHHRVSVRVKSLLDAVDGDAAAAGAGADDLPAGDVDLPGGANGAANGGADQRRAAAPAGIKGDEADEGGAAIHCGDAGTAAPALHTRQQQGIRREAAPLRASQALGPSQEVDGPTGGDDAEMADAGPAADGASGGGGDDQQQRQQQRQREEELLQLTLAPLSIDEGGTGTQPPAGGDYGATAGDDDGGWRGSQLSSQAAAAALEAVRAHALERAARGGPVDKLDVAAKFCAVGMADIDAAFEALVAEGALVRVDGERFARPLVGDSGDAGGGTATGARAGAGRNGGAMLPPPAPLPAAGPTTRGKRTHAAAAAAAAATAGGAGAGGGAAFDPFSAVGAASTGHHQAPHHHHNQQQQQQHVFDSSQTSRLGAGPKRKKTSFCATPISQGAIPTGSGAAGGGGCGDSAATTPGSGTHKGRGRLGAMRRGGGR